MQELVSLNPLYALAEMAAKHPDTRLPIVDDVSHSNSNIMSDDDDDDDDDDDGDKKKADQPGNITLSKHGDYSPSVNTKKRKSPTLLPPLSSSSSLIIIDKQKQKKPKKKDPSIITLSYKINHETELYETRDGLLGYYHPEMKKWMFFFGSVILGNRIVHLCGNANYQLNDQMDKWNLSKIKEVITKVDPTMKFYYSTLRRAFNSNHPASNCLMIEGDQFQLLFDIFKTLATISKEKKKPSAKHRQIYYTLSLLYDQRFSHVDWMTKWKHDAEQDKIHIWQHVILDKTSSSKGMQEQQKLSLAPALPPLLHHPLSTPPLLPYKPSTPVISPMKKRMKMKNIVTSSSSTTGCRRSLSFSDHHLITSPSSPSITSSPKSSFHNMTVPEQAKGLIALIASQPHDPDRQSLASYLHQSCLLLAHPSSSL